jgi:glutamyl-tRNA synthetase/glutamyl-Q tRNA(Asp) synthetase
MPAPLRTRFAPSPTGYLHLGHAAHIVFVWGVARALGAEILLRMEDHDRTRCRPEYEAGILDDLAWLGFSPDLGDPAQFRAGACAYRQSDCEAHYREALDALHSRDLLYACTCSRRELRTRSGNASIYDGYCRSRQMSWERPDAALRLRLDDNAPIITASLEQIQISKDAYRAFDPVVRDRHGCWTYHFAVVLDDLRQGVNLVVRGADLAGATALQVAMGRVLGRPEPPRYVHHPLITDATGAKLSKRDFARPLRELRAAGQSAEEVLGRAAHLVGLQGSPIPVDATTAMGLVATSPLLEQAPGARRAASEAGDPGPV